MSSRAIIDSIFHLKVPPDYERARIWWNALRWDKVDRVRKALHMVITSQSLMWEELDKFDKVKVADYHRRKVLKESIFHLKSHTPFLEHLKEV